MSDERKKFIRDPETFELSTKVTPVKPSWLRAEIEGNYLIPQVDTGINIFVTNAVVNDPEFNLEDFVNSQLSDEQVKRFFEFVASKHSKYDIKTIPEPDQLVQMWQDVKIAITQLLFLFKDLANKSEVAIRPDREVLNQGSLIEMSEYFNEPTFQVRLLKSLVQHWELSLKSEEAKELAKNYRTALRGASREMSHSIWDLHKGNFRKLLLANLDQIGPITPYVIEKLLRFLDV